MLISRPFLFDWLWEFEETTGLLLADSLDEWIVDQMMSQLETGNPPTYVNGIPIYETCLTPEYMLSQLLGRLPRTVPGLAESQPPLPFFNPDYLLQPLA